LLQALRLSVYQLGLDVTAALRAGGKEDDAFLGLSPFLDHLASIRLPDAETRRLEACLQASFQTLG
jgi:hypothetical protein